MSRFKHYFCPYPSANLAARAALLLTLIPLLIALSVAQKSAPTTLSREFAGLMTLALLRVPKGSLEFLIERCKVSVRRSNVPEDHLSKSVEPKSRER